MILFILAVGLFSLISGGIISLSGLFVPLMILGACLVVVAAGLINTIQIDTPSKIWIGYQVLLGTGIGLIFQVPATVAQSVVSLKDLAPVSSIILFSQTLGGAIWVSASQAGFVNRLIASLLSNAPGINPALVLATVTTDCGQSSLPKKYLTSLLPIVRFLSSHATSRPRSPEKSSIATNKIRRRPNPIRRPITSALLQDFRVPPHWWTSE